jgi:hypothetical protein
MQEREYGRLSEGKQTRPDGSVSRLSVAEIDPEETPGRDRSCNPAMALDAERTVILVHMQSTKYPEYHNGRDSQCTSKDPS